MAGSTATVIANSRTPASVILHIANDGNADVPLPTIPRATLLGELLEGPLKALLARTPNWTMFNFAVDSALADYIRITAIDGGLNLPILPPITSVVIDFLADALEFSITRDSEGLVACDLLVELRAEHSNER